MEEKTLYSIADTAKKLSVSEPNLRKYVSFFGICIEKVGRKVFLDEAAVAQIEEIERLRANDWSMKQIYDFREQGTKSDKPARKRQQTTRKPSSPAKTAKKTNVDVEQAAPPVVAESSPAQAEPPSAKTSQQRERRISSAKLEDMLVAGGGNSPPEEPTNEQQSEESGEQQQKTFPRYIKLNKPHQRQNRHEQQHVPLNKELFSIDEIRHEIAVQAKRVSRLQRFMSSRGTPRDMAEMNANFTRAYVFLAGLRHIRDTFLSKKEQTQLATVNEESDIV